MARPFALPLIVINSFQITDKTRHTFRRPTEAGRSYKSVVLEKISVESQEVNFTFNCNAYKPIAALYNDHKTESHVSVENFPYSSLTFLRISVTEVSLHDTVITEPRELVVTGEFTITTKFL